MADLLRDAVDAAIREQLAPLSATVTNLAEVATALQTSVRALELADARSQGADGQHMAAVNRAQATTADLQREIGVMTVEIHALATRLSAEEKHAHPTLEGRVEEIKRLTSTLGSLMEYQKRGNAAAASGDTKPTKKKYPLEGFVRCDECNTVWDLEMWRPGLGAATVGTVTCLTKDCRGQFRLPADILAA